MSAAAALAAGTVRWGNTSVGVTRYTVTDGRVPKDFSGFRIALVSDYHNTDFGRHNRRLVSAIRKESPDMIAVTGDMTDAIRTDIGVAAAFARQLVMIAPVYYVTGNHEARIGERFGQLEEELLSAGVNVLRDRAVALRRGDASITLIGLDDPRFMGEEDPDAAEVLGEKLRGMDLPEAYSVLLSHRPEAFGAYAANGIGLSLCGHAHGGQIRFPFLGGLYAPHQGFFPKYDAGRYTENGAVMIVSRGLGNSQFPVRLNDRPELVIVELQTDERRNTHGRLQSL